MGRYETKVVVCLCVILVVGHFVSCQAAETGRRSKRLWWVSAAVVAAASLLDVASSRGGVETNPLLRGQNGTFDTSRALLIKSVATGGMLATEVLLMRRSRGSERSAAVVNFASAGAITGLAVRNWKEGAQSTSH
jgi:hypothetical protein